MFLSSLVCVNLWNLLVVLVLLGFCFMGSKLGSSLGILAKDKDAKTMKVTCHGSLVMVLYFFIRF